jgi:hypothetical protein
MLFRAHQLFKGVLRHECVDGSTLQPPDGDRKFCGGMASCAAGFVCRPVGSNPRDGLVSFDNLPVAILTVFTCVTQEG